MTAEDEWGMMNVLWASGRQRSLGSGGKVAGSSWGSSGDDVGRIRCGILVHGFGNNDADGGIYIWLIGVKELGGLVVELLMASSCDESVIGGLDSDEILAIGDNCN